MIVRDQLDLSKSMSIRVRSKRTVRLILQRVFSTVIQLVLAHKRSFGDIVSSNDEIDVMNATIQLYAIEVSG